MSYFSLFPTHETHFTSIRRWLVAGPVALAQGRGNNKDKDRKEYKYDKSKKDKHDEDRYKAEGSPYGDGDKSLRSKGGLGGVLGRIILPTADSPGPRQLAGVPRGHYPPPGQCHTRH
jgi:hypothetical protein